MCDRCTACVPKPHTKSQTNPNPSMASTGESMLKVLACEAAQEHGPLGARQPRLACEPALGGAAAHDLALTRHGDLSAHVGAGHAEGGAQRRRQVELFRISACHRLQQRLQQLPSQTAVVQGASCGLSELV